MKYPLTIDSTRATSSIGTVRELYSLISLYWLFTVSAGGTYDGLKHEAY